MYSMCVCTVSVYVQYVCMYSKCVCTVCTYIRTYTHTVHTYVCTYICEFNPALSNQIALECVSTAMCIDQCGDLIFSPTPLCTTVQTVDSLSYTVLQWISPSVLQTRNPICNCALQFIQHMYCMYYVYMYVLYIHTLRTYV